MLAFFTRRPKHLNWKQGFATCHDIMDSLRPTDFLRNVDLLQGSRSKIWKVKTNGFKGTLKDGKLQYLRVAVLILLGFLYFTCWTPSGFPGQQSEGHPIASWPCVQNFIPKKNVHKVFQFMISPAWRPFKLQVAFLLFTSNLVDFVPGFGMN